MAVFEGAVARGGARRSSARYPAAHERSAIMPLLYLAQSVEGMVSREALREIGELLGITTAEVEAVATFYSMYRLRPTGDARRQRLHEPRVQAPRRRGGLRGRARGRRDRARRRSVSDDGLFTVHEEECLGVCDFAPAVQINFCNHDDGHARADARADRGAARPARCPRPPAARRSPASRPPRRALAGPRGGAGVVTPRLRAAADPQLGRPERGRARRLRRRRRVRGAAAGARDGRRPTSSRSSRRAGCAAAAAPGSPRG